MINTGVDPDTIGTGATGVDQAHPVDVVFPTDAVPGGTALVLRCDDGGLPVVRWVGVVRPGVDVPGLAAEVGAATSARAGSPLLVEHSRASYRRPGLRGHRLTLDGTGPTTGLDWSTAFTLTGLDVTPTRLTMTADDAHAGLQLRTEVEALTGGALRVRHVLTNTGAQSYLVTGLDVSLPLPDTATETLDFSGRHEHERVPQRRAITDGLWLRENRRGRTGLESPTVMIAGPAGFGFGHGHVLAAHVATSGNSDVWVERDPSGAATIGGGEYLLPGEIALGTDESYAGPWVVVAAGLDGIDDVTAALHAWERSWPAHPGVQPVVLNVWEAVFFDHSLDRLRSLADLAAQVGVERFVLDDGWFVGRRDDTAGLGDWWVDDSVWPDGLSPLADHVHGLGMQFGLWFEPEMINPDSQLFRAHPDWVLGVHGRLPRPWRNQQVLDLSNPDVFAYLLGRVDSVLSENAVDYVKWDHNRDLLEAGSSRTGVPVVHRQAAAHYALLDELRRRHPAVAWESCAAGGGRIDLGVLERVQRVWTSDMTDALARQHIQRWTATLVAPEYLGAHVSAPESHQTGRRLPLDFRAATALFGAFGIEWDLTLATADDLSRITDWVTLFRRLRPVLHSGRTVRLDTAEPAVLMHGVVAEQGESAVMALVQLDEASSNRGVTMRVPHLDRDAHYDLRWIGPVPTGYPSQSQAVHPDGPTGGVPVSGAVLGDVGVWLPRLRPETVLLLEATIRRAAVR